MTTSMQHARRNIAQTWDNFLFERDLYDQLGVSSYREARRDGDSRAKALRWALHPGHRLGWILMDAAASLHILGNKLAGKPCHDTMAQAWHDGFEHAERRICNPTPKQVERAWANLARRGNLGGESSQS